ncbi:MAG: 4Fe-4S binding protein [Anaerolineae bacterium]|nr:4Fe-4S binding protein [Anaerolineae bacterium]
MNLLQLARAAETLVQDVPAVTVDGARCQHATDKTSPCDLCAAACPSRAIQLDGGPVLDLSRCIRCGLCLNTCPAGVFDGADGAYRLLNCASKLVERRHVEIACAHHPDPSHGARGVDAVIQTDGCLSSLGASSYLGLLALGVETARVRLDACPDCPLRLMQPTIERTVQRAGALAMASSLSGRTIGLAESGSRLFRAKRLVVSVKNPPLSRRHFLRLAIPPAESAVDLLVERAEPQVSGPRSAPRERRRLLRALRRLPSPRQDAVLDDAEFTRLSASPACTACDLCARICPTGALELHKAEDAFALRFVAADCTNCGLCVEACSAGALSRSGAPSLPEVLQGECATLRSGPLQRCAKCHAAFSGDARDGLCPLCAARREQPFGAAIPDAVLKRLPDHVRARLQALPENRP